MEDFASHIAQEGNYAAMRDARIVPRRVEFASGKGNSASMTDARIKPKKEEFASGMARL
jgi:hypothetical protein